MDPDQTIRGVLAVRLSLPTTKTAGRVATMAECAPRLVVEGHMRLALRRIIILAHAALLWGCTTSKVIDRAEAGTDGPAACDDLVGGPIPGMPVATFDNDIEQFVFDMFPYTGGVTNLADPASGATPPPSFGYNGTEGNPTPGSLKINAPFSGPSQALVAYHHFGCAAPRDWTGKVLRARIKIVDGTFTGPTYLYVATTTTCAADGFGYAAPATLVRTSCWQDLILDLGAPGNPTAGYDPASVVDFGIQFVSGIASTASGPVTFLVDSFSVQ